MSPGGRLRKDDRPAGLALAGDHPPQLDLAHRGAVRARRHWLLGRRRREGWWFVIASQAGLLAIGLADRQYGLVVVLVLIWQAFRNWRQWGPAARSGGMNSDVVRGALWANDLTRIRHAGASRGQYAMVEVRSIWLLPKLAAAMDVDELVVHERLEHGCRAFAAWSWPDNAPASWLWVSTGEEYAPAVRRVLRMRSRMPARKLGCRFPQLST